jgi:hypothetical protein
MSAKPPIPEYIMKDLRERIGLENDDTSRDTEIMERLPMDNLRHLCAWEIGDSAWADWMVKRMRDLGIDSIKELTSLY